MLPQCEHRTILQNHTLLVSGLGKTVLSTRYEREPKMRCGEEGDYLPPPFALDYFISDSLPVAW